MTTTGPNNMKVPTSCPHGFKITADEYKDKACSKCAFVHLRNELSALRTFYRGAIADQEVKDAKKGLKLSSDEIPEAIWELHCNWISAVEHHQEQWESRWGSGHDLHPKEGRSVFEIERELALWYKGQHVGPDEWPTGQK